MKIHMSRSTTFLRDKASLHSASRIPLAFIFPS
jgi:hypothetical protein